MRCCGPTLFDFFRNFIFRFFGISIFVCSLFFCLTIPTPHTQQQNNENIVALYGNTPPLVRILSGDMSSDRQRLFEELISTISDSQSKKFKDELRDLLQKLPIDVNKQALESYHTHSSPQRSMTAASASRRLGGVLPGGAACHVALSTSNDPPANATLDLPSLTTGRGMTPRKEMRHFPDFNHEHDHNHILRNEEDSGGASKERLRIPKRPLAAIYQARVAPREDNTPHIFSKDNMYLRLGYSDIETKHTKKHLMPNPPPFRYDLLDISGPATKVQRKPSTSPRGGGGGGGGVTLDLAPVESPRHTLQSKIRETLLHTGKTVASTTPRHIPTIKERFEASYGPLMAYTTVHSSV